MIKCCNQLKMPYSANLFFQCLDLLIRKNRVIKWIYQYPPIIHITEPSSFSYIYRETPHRQRCESVCGRDLTFFFGMSPYKHRQQPTQQPVTLLGAASGNGSHRPFDSCENAPGKVGATSASEVQRKSAIVRRRLVRVLRRRCQAIRSNRARAIQHDAVLSRRPGFILPSC